MDEQTRTMLELESRKKSGVIAALLNLVFPGAGYWYCGHIVLGFVALVFTVVVAIVTLGLGAFVLWLLLIADGFLCADRYNKKLMRQALANAGPA